jgi:polyhydroxyalkanoate synthesis regulator phasin
MKKTWKIVGIAALVVVIGATAIGVAYAQTPTTPNNDGLFGFGCGGRLGEYASQFLDSLASKLGIQRSNLDSAVQAAREEVINQAVEDGKITQEQANWLLNPTDAAKQQVEQMLQDGKITQDQADWLLQGLDNGLIPLNRGFFGMGRGGRMGGFRFFENHGNETAPTPTPAPSSSQS